MPDAKTIHFYDTAAERYANLTKTTKPDDRLSAFMARLPPGGTVLDLGCGPARASVHLRAGGFRPDPVDASRGMIDLANDTHDIGARLLTFDQVDMVAAYDGVWANFSLLHAPYDDLPGILSAIARALRPGGIFHIAMKVGQGEERDAIDRLYTYVTPDDLQHLLTDSGFAILSTHEGTEVGCAGTDDPFIVYQARKDG